MIIWGFRALMKALGTGTFFFFIPRTISTDWASRRFRITASDNGTP